MVNKHLILYADDDPDDFELVKQCFEKNDHIEVLGSKDGSDLIKLLLNLHSQGIKPCLVILDINMPILNGKETLIRIVNNPDLNDIPIILFTTSKNPLDELFAKQHGAEFISKPISFNDVEIIAHRFMDKCNFEINKLKEKQI